MILKGSQRGNGADLAIHLMNGFDNESVEIAEVYGAVAGDLYGAFAEFEAVSRGTKAQDYLYSLSINPPSPLTREQYHEAIQMIEQRLELTDQPRAVVFHVKDGREHCHVVWSRIDVEHMRAVHMGHDRRKLMDLACELAHHYGLPLAPGLRAWEAKQKFEKEFLEASRTEKAMERETGITPEQRRTVITACYNNSDSAEAFRAALDGEGYILAKGDRRGYVVVDQFGDVHSLTRYIKENKASAVKERLALLASGTLPDVEQAKEILRAREQAKADIAREQEQERIEARRREAMRALAQKHEARRLEVRQAEQELLTRLQAERLALHAAQESEARGFLFRVRSAVAGLIARTPGLRSVLSHIQKMTQLDPKDRHRLERAALDRRHAREHQDFDRRKRVLDRLETREIASLEKALRRELREQQLEMELSHTSQEALSRVDNRTMQEFYDAARDQGLWRKREFKEGDLSVGFNDTAEFVEGAGKGGGDDDGHAPEQNAGADNPGDDDDNGGPKMGRRRKKGYGYRRDSE
jgi:hypothetical protein